MDSYADMSFYTCKQPVQNIHITTAPTRTDTQPSIRHERDEQLRSWSPDAAQVSDGLASITLSAFIKPKKFDFTVPLIPCDDSFIPFAVLPLNLNLCLLTQPEIEKLLGPARMRGLVKRAQQSEQAHNEVVSPAKRNNCTFQVH